MQYTHVVTGRASESQMGNMSDRFRGTKVAPRRECIGQPTTICETDDGRRLWVETTGLRRLTASQPEVGTGVFVCGCQSGEHKDHPVNQHNVLRILSHVLAVHQEAVKLPNGRGFEKGFLHDRAPGPEFLGNGLEQLRRMRKWPCTGFFCTEAKVAAYCAAQGWLEFNDGVTGSRITAAGIDEHARLLKMRLAQRGG